MESPTRLNYVREMHKIVWILLGVFALFAGTFPSACWRVSKMDKFKGFHVKSLSLAGKWEDSAKQEKSQDSARGGKSSYSTNTILEHD
ncbi:MAG TPA: hypothetical protein DEG17_13645 [Cyanobacteria bacterium UBA11149]|nr:hypothetical protein [Cyanobacteria bacterium UBA11367]HBE56378.1 hypothetical protein [Cyanobacteria bacterium UBA11366]HBK66790.1 hypothetical protein [Cyanobacteria bacterium UBA11166]HBR72693.1 hypothetical protein [Cyanobacteria bacterium UBA11159]HBS69158.1 hypothetical protein [Cyanobacteria bacterium UBA11153]HBW89886.1 hypothetical protein [Cyanobacteria bacterium UBA11149]HCA96984.1 hypothetical protein [Cyanobacteria bacterium UBA9226]